MASALQPRNRTENYDFSSPLVLKRTVHIKEMTQEHKAWIHKFKEDHPVNIGSNNWLNQLFRVLKAKDPQISEMDLHRWKALHPLDVLNKDLVQSKRGGPACHETVELQPGSSRKCRLPVLVNKLPAAEATKPEKKELSPHVKPEAKGLPSPIKKLDTSNLIPPQRPEEGDILQLEHPLVVDKQAEMLDWFSETSFYTCMDVTCLDEDVTFDEDTAEQSFFGGAELVDSGTSLDMQ